MARKRLIADFMGRTIVFHSLFAFLLALLVILIDHLAVPYMDGIPVFLLSPVDQSVGILSTLSGALLTVTIFLYSTTMVVLTTYSSQFSPRAIENFINLKSTRNVFGIFIGGTIYCLLALLTMQKTTADYTFLLTGIATIYVLVSLVGFIVFIQSVSRFIQVQNLLRDLEKQAGDIVDHFVHSRSNVKRVVHFDVDGYERTHQILSKKNGFFEENDIDLIRRLLRGQDYTIVLYPRMGDFVSINERVASIYYNGDFLTDEVLAELADVFILTERRYIDNDHRFALQKIIDVTLKALSAAINDPNTGIYCIRDLGVLAGKLSAVEGNYAVMELEREKGANAKIIDQDFVFERDLREMFIQIIHYGKHDITVVNAIYEALWTAYLVAAESNKKHLRAMAHYLYDSVEAGFSNSIETGLITDHMKRFA